MNGFFFVIGVMMLVVCPAGVFAAENVAVRDAWIRPMPPSQDVTAAFLVIDNSSDKDVILESASSEMAETVEIHEMFHQSGMMRMRMVEDGLRVPAHGQLLLQPGGNHLMLIGLSRPAVEGQKATLTLRFKGGLTLVTEAQIREPAESAATMDHR